MSWLDNAIVKFTRGSFEDGDLLTHDWLRSALQVPEPKKMQDVRDNQWMLMGRFETFRDLLLVEHKIALENVKGRGYRLVPPSEQARYAAEVAIRQVLRSIKKGEKIIENTRLNELDAAELKRHTDTQIRISGITRLMNRERKDVFKLFNGSKV